MSVGLTRLSCCTRMLVDGALRSSHTFSWRCYRITCADRWRCRHLITLLCYQCLQAYVVCSTLLRLAWQCKITHNKYSLSDNAVLCVLECGLKSVRFLSFTVWIVQTSCLITDTFVDFLSAVLRAKLLVLQEIAENWDKMLWFMHLLFLPDPGMYNL